MKKPTSQVPHNRLLEASNKRSRMRRLRAWFVTTRPGGERPPTGPTTWLCLQWLHAVRA